jgi:hypothetical protein
VREAGQKQRSSFEFRFSLVASRTQSGVDDNQECKRALGSGCRQWEIIISNAEEQRSRKQDRVLESSKRRGGRHQWPD